MISKNGKVSNFSINFSIQRSISTKKRVQFLENKIEEIENSDSQNFNMRQIQKYEGELNKIYEEKTKGTFIRSKANWMERVKKIILIF